MSNAQPVQFWIRRGDTGQIDGPFDSHSTVAVNADASLTPADTIGISDSGPWLHAAAVETLSNVILGSGQGRRTLAPLGLHLICLAAIAAHAFPPFPMGEIGTGAVRASVALSAFVIAMLDGRPVANAPRWLFVILGIVFLVPMTPNINRGGWFVLDWLAAFTTLIHANSLLQRVAPSITRKAVGWAFNMTLWLLVGSAILMMRC